jgi:hypothetical protein
MKPDSEGMSKPKVVAEFSTRAKKSFGEETAIDVLRIQDGRQPGCLSAVEYFVLAEASRAKGDVASAREYQRKFLVAYDKTCKGPHDDKGILSESESMFGVQIPFLLSRKVAVAIFTGDIDGALECQYGGLVGYDFGRAAKVARIIAERRQEQPDSEPEIIEQWHKNESKCLEKAAAMVKA